VQTARGYNAARSSPDESDRKQSPPIKGCRADEVRHGSRRKAEFGKTKVTCCYHAFEALGYLRGLRHQNEKRELSSLNFDGFFTRHQLGHSAKKLQKLGQSFDEWFEHR
jgi:hypothetical protein